MDKSTICPFCENMFLIEETIQKRIFFHCSTTYSSGCGGFFMSSESFSTCDEQKNRYLLHTNALEENNKNDGYKKYLEKYIQEVLRYEKKVAPNNTLAKLFDYGSGPYPALVQLLEEYKERGLLDFNTHIKHWDPFFYPNGDFFEHGADIVFCLEVVEHFENPLEGFQGLAKTCAQGGLIAIQTKFAPSTFDEFKTWWYKDDFTHVSFYTMTSIEECAKRVGLVVEGEEHGVVFLRNKQHFSTSAS